MSGRPKEPIGVLYLNTLLLKKSHPGENISEMTEEEFQNTNLFIFSPTSMHYDTLLTFTLHRTDHC